MFQFFRQLKRIDVNKRKTSKIFNECVVSKLDKMERLNKLDNLRKIIYSEYGTDYIRTNLYELFDQTLLMNIDIETDASNDPITIRKDRGKEREEVIDKHNELRISILNILVERSNVVFRAQYFLLKIRFFTHKTILASR